jgi:hypothetical protein
VFNSNRLFYLHRLSKYAYLGKKYLKDSQAEVKSRSTILQAQSGCEIKKALLKTMRRREKKDRALTFTTSFDFIMFNVIRSLLILSKNLKGTFL